MDRRTGARRTSGVVIAALAGGFAGTTCFAQCTQLLRETFRFGERPHGNNGRPRVVELEDRLHDYWPQASSIGARWISADQAPMPLWQFAWSSGDPAEIDPPEGPDGHGTAFGDPGAAVMIPFGAPASAFTMSADFAVANGVVFIGYTTTTAFVNNFQSDGSLWISIDANVDWTIHANGDQVVATGHSSGGGVLSGGFYRVEMTYDPAASLVWGRAAGEAFGPFPVALARPLTYFGMEAHQEWCVLNNISIYTGAPVQIETQGPASVCAGAIATLTASTNAQPPAGFFWFQGDPNTAAPLVDGVRPSGAVISGAGTYQMTISNIAVEDLGAYSCVVSNDCGLHESAAFTLRSCVADQNCSGFVSSQDFFDFLSEFFQSGPAADVNHDGMITSQDFFDFLAAFFAGC